MPAAETKSRPSASPVDVKGNSVDVKGNNVDVKGNIVDVKGKARTRVSPGKGSRKSIPNEFTQQSVEVTRHRVEFTRHRVEFTQH
eukprot:1094637-Prorocentrum_minimum.AAC.1